MRPTTASYFELPEVDDAIMTVEEYLADVEAGGFTDDDGFGHPMKSNQIGGDLFIYPSGGENSIPLDATHIVWYNR